MVSYIFLIKCITVVQLDSLSGNKVHKKNNKALFLAIVLEFKGKKDETTNVSFFFCIKILNFFLF